MTAFSQQPGEEGSLGWLVGLGRTLASRHGQDWPVMSSCLQLVRQELLESLSAVSEKDCTAGLLPHLLPR